MAMMAGAAAGDGANKPESDSEEDADLLEGLTFAQERKMAIKRNVVNICLLFSYAGMLYVQQGGSNFGSVAGMKAEFLDELLPELDKAVERVTYNQVGTEMDKVMQADDMVRILSMAQRFCISEGGFNGHFRESYTCRIMQIKIEWPDGMNTEDEAKNNARKLPVGMNCDTDIIKKHVKMGDDPFLVPWGLLPEELQANASALNDEANALSFEPDLFSYQEDSYIHQAMEFKRQQRSLKIKQIKKEMAAIKVEQLAQENMVNHVKARVTAGRHAQTLRESQARAAAGKIDSKENKAAAVELINLAGLLDDGTEAEIELRQPRMAEVSPAGGVELAGEVARAEGAGPGPTARQAVQASGETEDAGDKGGAGAPGAVRPAALVETGVTAAKPGGRGKRRTGSNLKLEDLDPQEQVHIAEKAKYLNEWRLRRIQQGLPSECYTMTLASATNESMPAEYKVRGGCRNHHWGILAVCQPQRLSVQFKVQYGDLDKALFDASAAGKVKHHGYVIMPYKKYVPDPHTFMTFTLNFRAAALDGKGVQTRGVYNAVLETTSGEYPGEKGWPEILAVVIFIGFFLWGLGAEVITMLMLPVGLTRLVLARRSVRTADDLKTQILFLFDPSSNSRQFMSLLMMIVALGNSCQIVVAIIKSAVAFATDPMIDDAIVMTRESHPCDLKRHTILEYTMNCLDHLPSTTMWSKPAELMISPLFNVEGSAWHEQAVFMLFLQTLNLFNQFKATAWVGATMAVAVKQMVSFLVVFASLVGGFAFLIFIRFGPDFPQFSTLWDCAFSLALFSFDMPDIALEQTDAFFWTSARVLLIFLLIYSIVVLTFAINILTTIVIDAFYAAKTVKMRSSRVSNHHNIIYYCARRRFFPNLELNERDQKILRGKSAKDEKELEDAGGGGLLRTLTHATTQPLQRAATQAEDAPGPAEAGTAPDAAPAAPPS